LFDTHTHEEKKKEKGGGYTERVIKRGVDKERERELDR
jgi:hypothetical protein